MIGRMNGGRFLNKFSSISEMPNHCFTASLYNNKQHFTLKVGVLYWAAWVSFLLFQTRFSNVAPDSSRRNPAEWKRCGNETNSSCWEPSSSVLLQEHRLLKPLTLQTTTLTSAELTSRTWYSQCCKMPLFCGISGNVTWGNSHVCSYLEWCSDTCFQTFRQRRLACNTEERHNCILFRPLNL